MWRNIHMCDWYRTMLSLELLYIIWQKTDLWVASVIFLSHLVDILPGLSLTYRGLLAFMSHLHMILENVLSLAQISWGGITPPSCASVLPYVFPTKLGSCNSVFLFSAFLNLTVSRGLNSLTYCDTFSSFILTLQELTIFKWPSLIHADLVRVTQWELTVYHNILCFCGECNLWH